MSRFARPSTAGSLRCAARLLAAVSGPFTLLLGRRGSQNRLYVALRGGCRDVSRLSPAATGAGRAQLPTHCRARRELAGSQARARQRRCASHLSTGEPATGRLLPSRVCARLQQRGLEQLTGCTSSGRRWSRSGVRCWRAVFRTPHRFVLEQVHTAYSGVCALARSH
jgi:hypothetical protein